MVRNAQIGDLESVYALMCELENRTLEREAFERIYKEQLLKPNHVLLVYEEGAVLGVLHLRMEEQLHHAGKIAEIMELSVQEGCRSKGIGKQLFDCAAKLAKAFDCLQLEVASNQLRDRAHRFYERQGMKNFHYKLSLKLDGSAAEENVIGV